MLLLGLIHLLVIPEGTAFLPSSLSVGGGIIGAIVSSVLQQFLGFFGAFLAIVGAAIVTFLIWKNWSISQPVAVVADKAGQEAARVSGKAVEGLQDASHSLRQWHEKRKIFDFQALDQAPQDEPEKAATAVPEAQPEGIQISDARDLGNGVEEVTFDARPIEEKMPAEGADDYWDDILEQGAEEMEDVPDYSQIHENVVSDTEPTAVSYTHLTLPTTERV